MLLRESCGGNNIQIILFKKRFKLDLYFKQKKIWEISKKNKAPLLQQRRFNKRHNLATNFSNKQCSWELVDSK